MRSIDAGIMAQLASGELRPFILIGIDLGSGFNFTDCDAPIVYSGTRYENRGFDLSGARYSLSTIVDSCHLEVDDLDQDLKPEFIGGTPQGAAVSVKLVVLDADYHIIGPDHVTWFEGEIDDWEYEDAKVPMTLASMFVRWNRKTLSKHSPSCRWPEFKGTDDCKYSGGETWCDRTYTRCAALGNTANFGGCRWLQSIENKVIWWGDGKV